MPKIAIAVFAGALLLIAGTIALTNESPVDGLDTSSVDRRVDAPTQDLAAAPSTQMATLAGFKVKKHYKCIASTCTDSWCDANCNHVPKYCPANFCKAEQKKIPVPTPPPTAVNAPPTTPPTPAPTCEKTNA